LPYCSQCGVEVDENVLSCPLCQTPIQMIDEQGFPKSPYPEKAAGSPPLPPLTLGEKMGIARTITTIGFLIPLLFVTAIDYFINKSVSWSAIVDISLVGIWIITITCLFSWKKPYLLSFLIHLDIVAFLFVLTLIMGGSQWMIRAGIPITIWSNVIIWLTLYIIRRIRKKGTLVAGVILLSIGLLCGAIDLTLVITMKGVLKLGWSLIVISVMLPTAVLLFYLQSARFTHSTFRRFFHF
jgi:hypothetical protein